MPLLPSRTPTPIALSSPDEALHLVRAMLRKPTYSLVAVMDIIDAAVSAFPGCGTPLLAVAYDIFAAQSDTSRYHMYQERTFAFPIHPGDAVLDMGSGHNPFPLATHLADISLTRDDIGRAGVPFRHVDGKPAYECHVEETPFADKQFDFVYCSHVLEHATDPAAACRELMRIGKRGYIETPTRGKDVFLASARISNHKNAVELRNNVLTFWPYSDAEIRGLNFNILQQMHSTPQTDREKAFSALLYLYPQAVNTMLLWENEFSFEVINDSKL